jgi:hypothetical protein
MRKVLLVISLLVAANTAQANEYGASIGRTMVMNSAICSQTKTCLRRTPEQEREFKAIGKDAGQCISSAFDRYKRDDRARDHAVKMCKAKRDARYAGLESRTKRG